VHKKRQSLNQLCQSQTASQDVVFSLAANLVPFRGDGPEKMHAHSRSPFYCVFDNLCKDQFGLYICNMHAKTKKVEFQLKLQIITTQGAKHVPAIDQNRPKIVRRSQKERGFLTKIVNARCILRRIPALISP
jgi:hypothetical protein